MCKFDKNKTYTNRDIASLVYAKYGSNYASYGSVIGVINHIIKKRGIASVNGQKSHRVYPGNICQQIYEEIASRHSNRKQISVDDVSTKVPDVLHRPVNVQFVSPEGMELERRSRITGIPKNKILEPIMKAYFDANPCDEFDAMSLEELKAYIRKNLRG